MWYIILTTQTTHDINKGEIMEKLKAVAVTIAISLIAFACTILPFALKALETAK